MLLLMVVILGALYFMGENDDDDDKGSTVSAPLITFWVEEDSNGLYHVEVINVTKQKDLEDFSFYLNDGEGQTCTVDNCFGEIAMQYKDGKEMGISTNYYGNDDRLRSRADNVSEDDGSVYPVHFSDNDRDGKLSAGDQFLVYGKGGSDVSKGPAEDGWRLEIQFDPSGDIVGSAKLI